MVNSINSILGSVAKRAVENLDSSRYEYITLDQTEPSPGNPSTDGQLYSSKANGERGWTSLPRISGLEFIDQALDSGSATDLYALFLKGDPSVSNGLHDSVVFRKLNLGAFSDTETLQSVTDRGDSTNVYVKFTSGLEADSVLILGNLTVQGTQTILNTEIVEIKDLNILLAKGSATNAQANGAGITIDGSFAELSYKSVDNSWNMNRKLNLDSGLDVSGPSTMDSATITSDFVIENVPSSVTAVVGLFLDPSTNQVVSRTISTDILDGTVKLTNVITKNNDQTYYPAFVSVLNGADSAAVDSDLSYNPSQNRLTVRNLSLRGISLDATSDDVLVISANDSVSFRQLGALAYQDSEEDTLATVVSRGNTTLDSVEFGKVTVNGDLKASRYYDPSDRQLLIYDSLGATLWGA